MRGIEFVHVKCGCSIWEGCQFRQRHLCCKGFFPSGEYLVCGYVSPKKLPGSLGHGSTPYCRRLWLLVLHKGHLCIEVGNLEGLRIKSFRPFSQFSEGHEANSQPAIESFGNSAERFNVGVRLSRSHQSGNSRLEHSRLLREPILCYSARFQQGTNLERNSDVNLRCYECLAIFWIA